MSVMNKEAISDYFNKTVLGIKKFRKSYKPVYRFNWNLSIWLQVR